MARKKVKRNNERSLNTYIEPTKLRDYEFNPDMYVPRKTNKTIDRILSSEEGLMPATVYMAHGSPGIGKTTIFLDCLAEYQKAGYNCLYLNTETMRDDMYTYLKKVPALKDIPSIYLEEYLSILNDDNQEIEEKIDLFIEQIFYQGYDVILLDSFSKLVTMFRNALGWRYNEIEYFLTKLIVHTSFGNNEKNLHTSFILVSQETKGGKYVGAKSLEHNITGRFSLSYDDTGKAYIMCHKNRRGGLVNRRLYFEDHGDRIEYKSKHLENELENEKRVEEDKEKLKNNEEQFNQLFGLEAEEDVEETLETHET